LKTNKIEKREEKIIQFIKDNQYCSLDSIFTKGGIPKSKATNELIKKLVLENKIHVIGSSRKKYFTNGFQYDGDENWIKGLGNITKLMEEDIKKNPEYDNKLSRRILEFFKLRVRVLTSERKKSKDVDIRNTLRIMHLNMQYSKNPNKMTEFLLSDSLYWAIEDDKYYLAHELHSNPINKKRKFHKARIGSRRSVETLLDMKKKGSQEYGLTGKDFKKNMERLTNDPQVWWDRFFAEQNRTLYENSPELRDTIHKKILDKTKLKPDIPDYENRKKVLEASKEAFPDFPVAVIFDILSEDEKTQLRKDFKELGDDFDLFEKKMRKMKTIGNFNSDKWKDI